MSKIASASVRYPTSIPIREVVPWAIFVVLVSLLILYFVGFEQGAVALTRGDAVHEVVHDARHVMGFPCH